MRVLPLGVPRMPLGAAAVLTLATACRDFTGPGLSVVVTPVIVSGPTITTSPEGYATIACGVTLWATATGTGRAEWQAAVFRWFSGRDSTTPIDTQVVDAATIRSAWDNEVIEAGARQQAHWNVWAGIPFVLEIEHRLVIGRRSVTTSTRFACRPPTPPAANPPVITALSVSPTGPYEPGDTIRVSFSAASDAGLWQSWAGIDGPCQAGSWRGEQLARVTTRIVEVVLPSSCRLGVEATAVAFAVDVNDRYAGQGIPLGPLVDRTAPTFTVWLGSVYSEPAGDYFVGDTLLFLVEASDNHLLGWVVWQIPALGIRDSVRAQGASSWRTVSIPAVTALVGAPRFEFAVRDSVGNTAATFVTAENAIRVYPTAPAARVYQIDRDVWDVIFDPARDVLYLLQGNQHRIAVFSPATGRVTSTMDIGGFSRSFDVSPSGDSLVFAVGPRLSVLDLRTGAQSWIDLAGVAATGWVEHLRVLDGSRVAFVVNGDTPVRELGTYDLATGTQRPWYGMYGALGRSGDRRMMAINTVEALRRYDVAGDSVSPPGDRALPVGSTPHVSSNGDWILVSTQLYDADGRFVRQIQGTSSIGYASTISPDGEYVFWQHERGVVRARSSDGAWLERIRCNLTPTLMRMSPDGRWLVIVQSYIYQTYSLIAVYDTRQLP